MNLTTLTRFKTYAGITGTTSDAQLTVLITQVSDMIAQYLGIENMELAERTDYVTALAGDIIRLPSWPIVEIYEVLPYTLELGEVYNNASDTVKASVSTTTTELILRKTNSTGTASSSSLEFADYKTAATLKAAIEALSGWNFDINSTYENYPTVNTKPKSGLFALYPDKVSLYIPDFKAEMSVEEWDKDIVRLTWGVAAGTELFVSYKAGYELPTDEGEGTLPAGLLFLVNKLLMDVWSGVSKSGQFSSESLGDYSYSKRSDVVSIFDSYKQELDLFRRKVI